MATSRRRILVVEHNPLLAQILCAALDRLGHEVEIIVNVPQSADWLVNRDQVELIVLDLDVDGGAGFELAEAVRRERPGAPMVMLRGADRSGAAPVPGHVLTKPFRLAAFRDAVQAHLAKTTPLNTSNNEQIVDRAMFDGWLRCIKSRRTTKALELFKAQLHRTAIVLEDEACTCNSAVEAVHGLIGSTGMLGFTSLCLLSQQFQEVCGITAGEEWRGWLPTIGAALSAAIGQLDMLEASTAIAA